MHAAVPCRVHAVRVRQSQLYRAMRTSHYIPRPSFGCAIRSVDNGRRPTLVMAIGGDSDRNNDDIERQRAAAVHRLTKERSNQAAGIESKPSKV